MCNTDVNGCGPAWLPKWSKKLMFNFMFEASCNKHDEGYTEGGDEIRRFECDWKFLQAMKRDVKRLPKSKQFVYMPIAYTYYYMVRVFGKYNFTYV